MSVDSATRRRLLDFEIGLDREVSDEVVEHPWGSVFLCPSLPLVSDASWLAIERVGMTAPELIELADEALGGAGLPHRTLALCDESDGRRLAPAFESIPGWDVDRARQMIWRGESGRRAASPTKEATLAEVLPLRRRLIAETLPPGVPRAEQTVEQLLELDRRYGDAAGDRWFVAGLDGEPASACRLLLGDGLAQVEEVATLPSARQRGLAQAVVLAAIDAARAAAAETIFLVADATDWPQLMYGRLGFEPAAEYCVARRRR